MARPELPAPENGEMEKLLVEILPDIPAAVRKACHSLGHHPDQTESDGFVQRIILLLMYNDFHTLRSFTNRSDPQTWLYTIARRQIMRRLEEQKRVLPLEDLPADSFTSPPDQEGRLIWKEGEKLLLAAVSKLTERKQKLLSLMLRGLKSEEIAKEMKIKKASVYRERSALIKKLRNIIKGE